MEFIVSLQQTGINGLESAVSAEFLPLQRKKCLLLTTERFSFPELIGCSPQICQSQKV
jgi:hypothetical protein